VQYKKSERDKINNRVEVERETVRAPVAVSAAGKVCGNTLWFLWGGLTCLEWDFGSGGLKNESGSFLILIGTEGGTMVFFGFITALKRASRSVSESPRTWTIWWPTGGLC